MLVSSLFFLSFWTVFYHLFTHPLASFLAFSFQLGSLCGYFGLAFPHFSLPSCAAQFWIISDLIFTTFEHAFSAFSFEITMLADICRPLLRSTSGSASLVTFGPRFSSSLIFHFQLPTCRPMEPLSRIFIFGRALNLPPHGATLAQFFFPFRSLLVLLNFGSFLY